jgi:hypothetical protein
MQNTIANIPLPPQEGLSAPPMTTYAHAATEEYDMPSNSTSMAQKLKLPPPDFIHRTRYNPTQGTNKPHHQEITKKGNNGTRATCIHTHCH